MRGLPRPLLNEVLSITAQEFVYRPTVEVVVEILNEVLSITAQESARLKEATQDGLSSMKS